MQGKILMGILLIASLLLGILFVSAVATGKNPIDYISSIQVANSGNDNILGISESQESANLASLVKITAEQAKAIALKEVTGLAKKVELENENGNVIYSVEIIRGKKSFDVKIDSGNGNVLKVENGISDKQEKENAETESEKESDSEKDGINHQFEGEEEHED